MDAIQQKLREMEEQQSSRSSIKPTIIDQIRILLRKRYQTIEQNEDLPSVYMTKKGDLFRAQSDCDGSIKIRDETPDPYIIQHSILPNGHQYQISVSGKVVKIEVYDSTQKREMNVVTAVHTLAGVASSAKKNIHYNAIIALDGVTHYYSNAHHQGSFKPMEGIYQYSQNENRNLTAPINALEAILGREIVWY